MFRFILMISAFVMIILQTSMAAGDPQPPSTSYSLLRFIFSLVFVFIVFYIIIFILKFILMKKNISGNKNKVKLLENYHLGPNLSVYLLESQGTNLLIGVNTHHITLLQEIKKDEEEIIVKNDKDIITEGSFKNFIQSLSGRYLK